MKNKKISTIFWGIIAVLIVFADQYIKRNILKNYTVGEIFGEIPGIANFIYVKNTGAAFSMFSNNTIILAGISVLFCIVIALYWRFKKKSCFMQNLACTLIFAGALGNAIDRVAYRFVVDFISIKWFNFPVFNIADIAIVAGAIAAVLYVIFFDKDDNKKVNEKSDEKVKEEANE